MSAIEKRRPGRRIGTKDQKTLEKSRGSAAGILHGFQRRRRERRHTAERREESGEDGGESESEGVAGIAIRGGRREKEEEERE